METENTTSGNYGTLWLIPATLDFGTDTSAGLGQFLPDGVITQASQISHWIVENAKTARAMLKRYGEVAPLVTPLQQMQITEMPRHTHKQGDAGFDARPLLQAALDGHDVGLMSEAGLPAIADPGASVVRAAHDLHIRVQPLVGPSSILLALISSGLSGQNFAFTGYLPTQADERKKRIKELENLALRLGQTQLFMETPYRNEAMLDALLTTLTPSTRLAVAFGLTLPNAWQSSMPVSVWEIEWKKLKSKQPGSLSEETLKLPAVFAIGK